jgi:hypothetical protein
MRNRLLGIFLGLAVVVSFSARASAQTKDPAAPAKGASSSNTPDLSGVWMRDAPPATAAQYWIYELNQEEPPMTAWGKEQLKAAKSSFGSHEYPLEETNDPVLSKCYPPGVPRVYMHPFPFQFIQIPGEVVMLFEVDSLRREIYTDGAQHDPALVPLWMGNSIGHWEGDTLVVDTVNFNDRTWLDDITVDDPKAYTKPWTARLEFKLQPWKLTEQFCVDGESFMGLEKKEASQGK